MKIFECPECEGKGWDIGSSNSTSYDKDGNPVYEQVPIQVQCERCYGTGEITINEKEECLNEI